MNNIRRRFLLAVLAGLATTLSAASPDFESSAIPLTADGRVSGMPRVVGPGYIARLATDGESFLAVFGVLPNVVQTALHARALDSGLSVVSDVQIAQKYNPNIGALLWRNGRYELLLGGRDEPSGNIETVSLALAANATVLGTGPGNHRTWAAGTNGSDLAVVLVGSHPSATWVQLFAAVYRGQGTAAEPQELLSGTGNPHKKPVVAASPRGALVAWDEEESGSFYTRVAPDGTSLDGRGISIGRDSEGISAAFDGTSYVVAWRIGNRGWGMRRIDAATGETISEVLVEGGIEQIAVAASREATYVVQSSLGVRVTRIPHSTNIPDPVPLELLGEDAPDHATAAGAGWNGSELLVVWNQNDGFRGDPPNPARGAVRGARVTANLTLLDPEPLSIIDYGMGSWYDSFSVPAIASNGADWLVLSNVNEYDNEIFARRVQRNGTVLGTEQEKVANGYGAAAAWDGSRYVVAWNGLGTARVMTLSGTGPLAPTREQVVATDITGAPVIAVRNGEAAIAYSKISFRPEHGGVERTFLRYVVPGALRGRVVRR